MKRHIGYLASFVVYWWAINLAPENRFLWLALGGTAGIWFSGWRWRLAFDGAVRTFHTAVREINQRWMITFEDFTEAAKEEVRKALRERKQ